MRKISFKQVLFALLAFMGITWTGKKVINKNHLRSPKVLLWGEWTLFLERPTRQKKIRISQEGDFFIDSRKIEGEMLHTSKQAFIFKDHFGYRMELQLQEDGSVTFYDEADDSEYREIEQ